jgi:hypothetical protein
VHPATDTAAIITKTSKMPTYLKFFICIFPLLP